MNPKKIHIIGGPGSGKTYIAKKLSSTLKIPCYDLDDIYWDNKAKTYDTMKDPKLRDKEFSLLLKKDKWIIEGVYGHWNKMGFKKADLIIILKQNRFIRTRRLFWRYFKTVLNIEDYKRRETWKYFWSLVKFSWNYYKIKFPEVYENIEPYKNKAITITRFNAEDILKKSS